MKSTDVSHIPAPWAQKENSLGGSAPPRHAIPPPARRSASSVNRMTGRRQNERDSEVGGVAGPDDKDEDARRRAAWLADGSLRGLVFNPLADAETETAMEVGVADLPASPLACCPASKSPIVWAAEGPVEKERLPRADVSIDTRTSLSRDGPCLQGQSVSDLRGDGAAGGAGCSGLRGLETEPTCAADSMDVSAESERLQYQQDQEPSADTRFESVHVVGSQADAEAEVAFEYASRSDSLRTASLQRRGGGDVVVNVGGARALMCCKHWWLQID